MFSAFYQPCGSDPLAVLHIGNIKDGFCVPLSPHSKASQGLETFVPNDILF